MTLRGRTARRLLLRWFVRSRGCASWPKPVRTISTRSPNGARRRARGPDGDVVAIEPEQVEAGIRVEDRRGVAAPPSVASTYRPLGTSRKRSTTLSSRTGTCPNSVDGSRGPECGRHRTHAAASSDDRRKGTCPDPAGERYPGDAEPPGCLPGRNGWSRTEIVANPGMSGRPLSGEEVGNHRKPSSSNFAAEGLVVRPCSRSPTPVSAQAARG